MDENHVGNLRLSFGWIAPMFIALRVFAVQISNQPLNPTLAWHKYKRKWSRMKS